MSIVNVNTYYSKMGIDIYIFKIEQRTVRRSLLWIRKEERKCGQNEFRMWLHVIIKDHGVFSRRAFIIETVVNIAGFREMHRGLNSTHKGHSGQIRIVIVVPKTSNGTIGSLHDSWGTGRREVGTGVLLSPGIDFAFFYCVLL